MYVALTIVFALLRFVRGNNTTTNNVTTSTTSTTTITTNAKFDNVIKNTLSCTCHECDLNKNSIIKGVVKHHDDAYDCYVIVSENSLSPKEREMRLPAANNLNLLSNSIKLLSIYHERFFVTNDHKLSSGHIYLFPQMIIDEKKTRKWIESLPDILKTNIQFPSSNIDLNCLIITMTPQPHLAYNCISYKNKHSNAYRFKLFKSPFDVYNSNGLKIASMDPRNKGSNIINGIMTLLSQLLLAIIILHN